MYGVKLRDVAFGDEAVQFFFFVVQTIPGDGICDRNDAVVRRDLFVIKGRTFDFGICLGNGRSGRGERTRNGGQHPRGIGVLQLRQKTAVRTRVARDLVLFVKRLADVQGVFGGVTEEAACLNLNVRKRIRFGLQRFFAFRFRLENRRRFFLREFLNERLADVEIDEKFPFFIHPLLPFGGFPLCGEGFIVGAQLR